MNKVCKKSCAFILTLILILSLFPLGSFTSFAAKSGDFEYNIMSEQDKTCELKQYLGNAKELVIPQKVDGYTVKQLGWGFCCDNTAITSVTVPDSVTSIESGAFCGCTALGSINLPNSIVTIGAGIKAHAFSNTLYYNTESNWENGVLYIGNYLVDTNRNRISNTYSIKSGTTLIAQFAFEGCWSLTKIEIPNSVTSICNNAFWNCTSLRNVVLPNSLTYLGNAFYECSSLTNITIPNSVTSIENYTFAGTALRSITIPNSVTSIGSKAFSGCTALTIYGFSGSYAESYAREYGYTFVDLVTGRVTVNALTYGTVNLSVFDKTPFLKSNIDFANAMHKLRGVNLSTDTIRQAFDMESSLTSVHRNKTVTLSKSGYQDYVLPAEVVNSWLSNGAMPTQNIYMLKDRKDGKPYITGAYARESGQTVAYTDLQSESLTAMDNTAYDIILSAHSNGESITEYVLSQDNTHKISSKNGIFSAAMLTEKFSVDKPMYAYVKTASGKTSEPLSVKLKITSINLNRSTFSLVGPEGQSITFAEDAPLVGGAQISLEGLKCPLGVELEGNRFKISFGINLFPQNHSKGDPWSFFKQYVSTIKDSTEDAVDKLNHYKNFVRNFAPGQSYFDKEGNFDTSLLGYAEGYIVNGEWIYTDFCGEIALKFTFNYTQQGTIWVIPVYTYLNCEATTAIQLQTVRSLPDRDVPFDFGFNINLTPSAKLGGGVGVKGAISGGLYGKLALPVALQIAQRYATVKFTGEMGIEGEFFCFKGKKPLVNGELILYDNYFGKAKTAAVQNVLRCAVQASAASQDATAQDGTVTTVMPRDYAENTSRWLGNDYLKKFFSAKSSVADGLTVKELQTSVFKNSQTQLIALNDGTMLAAWIEDDSARNTYNRMRLVYSVYKNGSWSKPKAVSDDGTNDAYPSLATDGKTVYIAWQNLKRTLTSRDAASIDAVLQNSEICIAKYDTSKNVFANEKTLTSNTRYDYSPSLAVENAQAVLYWQQSTNNDLSAAGSNSIYRYTTATDTTTQVQSGLNYMSDMACAFVNGKDEVAFSMDADGNLSTTTDVYAYTISNGVLTQQTPSKEALPSADFAVCYGKIDGQNTLFFADSTHIYYKQNGEVKKVFATAHAVNGDLQVLENGTKTDLLWTEVSEAGTEIWLCSYSEGSWSEPVQISSIGALLHNVSAVYQNGVIQGIFNRTARMQENGAYVNGQTDFCYMTLADFTDLEASLITVNESDFSIGETAKIPVYLKNNGTEDITEVEIRITDTLGTNQTARFFVDLPSGSETFIDVSYLVPQNYGETTLTVCAIIPNTEEATTTNNSDSIEIGSADIALSEITVNDIGEYFVLSAVLKNRNPIVAKQVQVKICSDSSDGNLLDFIKVGDLQPKEMRTIQYVLPKNEVNYDIKNSAKIFFSLSSSSFERNLENNNSCAVLAKEKNQLEADILGDINGDGVVNTIDARWALQAASGIRPLSDAQSASADVNGDGTVNTVDARWILQAASGIRVL